MGGKNTNLAITISTVDKATAKIRAISAQLDAASKPRRDLTKAIAEFGEKAGFNGVIDGFKGVGSAIGDLLGKVAMIGGVAGVAVAGLVKISDHYDELGKKAARIGIGADELAGLRDAAERTGVPIEELDAGVQTFSINMAKFGAGTGKFKKFVDIVAGGTSWERQLKAAKGITAQIAVMSAGISRLKDPEKRLALVNAGFGGDGALAPLLAKGPKAVQDMIDRYNKLAPGQAAAAEQAEKLGKSQKDLSNTFDGVKASLLIGLGPAIDDIVKRLTVWLTGHQADIKQWAEDIGKKLPVAIQAVVTWLGKAYDKASAFIDKIGGIKNAAIGVAAILAGPLIKAVASLSISLLTAGSRALALARGVGSIPASIGGGGGAASVAGTAAKTAGAGIFTSIAWPIAAGFAAKAALKHFGLDDLGGGNDIVKRTGKTSVWSQWAIQGGYADDPDAPEGPSASAPIQDQLEDLRAAPDRNAALENNLAQLVQLMSQLADSKKQQVSVAVDFKNMPKGVRATVDPMSSADVALDMGYQMLFGP